MAREYVEQREGAYRVSGTRVSLDSVVYAFLRGSSPESIAQSFPVLTLEEVYGAIAFYLGHQDEVDAYLQDGEREFELSVSKPASRIRSFTGNSRKAADTHPRRENENKIPGRRRLEPRRRRGGSAARARDRFSHGSFGRACGPERP